MLSCWTMKTKYNKQKMEHWLDMWAFYFVYWFYIAIQLTFYNASKCYCAYSVFFCVQCCIHKGNIYIWNEYGHINWTHKQYCCMFDPICVLLWRYWHASYRSNQSKCIFCCCCPISFFFSHDTVCVCVFLFYCTFLLMERHFVCLMQIQATWVKEIYCIIG